MSSTSSTTPQPASSTFTPRVMFFYGTLMDADVLTRVAQLDSPPLLRDAHISGFRMKLWGHYPTLVPSSPDSIIKGKAWTATTEDQVRRLTRYETDAYKSADAVVHLTGDDGEEEKVEGSTFVWAEHPEFGELSEGGFDLGEWQERHKRYF